MPQDSFYAVLYLVFVVGGLFGIVEARSYTAGQRAAVHRLWWTYVGGMALAAVLGVVAIVLTLVASLPLWIPAAVGGSLGVALPLVQWRMNGALGLDRSPLRERFE